jgi:nucleoside-diphosphate-sugar epimerase
MKVFILGGTGLVGGAVAKTLKARGHEVGVLTRTKDQATDAMRQGFTAVQGDMARPETWIDEAAAADALVNAAVLRPGKRLSRKWVAQASAADRIAFQGLLAAARKGGKCQTIIYTSGISVYGDHGDSWVDETSALRPGIIGRMKLAGEKAALEALQEGLPVCVLRPGLVYAPQGVFAEFFLAEAAKKKFNYIGQGNAFHSTVYVKDLANAYALAIEKASAGEIFNVVDDHPMRGTEFAKALLDGFNGGKAKGAPPWLVALFAGKPLVEMLTASYRVKNQKIRDYLGWRPSFSSLGDGLPEVISEFNSLRLGSSEPMPGK